MINCFQYCFSFAFKFNLRRYTMVDAIAADYYEKLKKFVEVDARMKATGFSRQVRLKVGRCR
jgi:hypothetical protein